MKKKIIIFQLVAFILLVAISLFLRFYKLDQMFGFFGDIARDHEKLMELYQGGSPPLVGPNTILMIINQSPWYFYINFPVFLITRSPYSMTITLSLISIATFALGLFILRKYKEISFIYIIFFLSSIHPMFVEQQRIPWNPSFSVPFLILGISGVIYLRRKYSKVISWITALSLCLSLGMTYSIFPVFLAIIILVFLSIPPEHRKYWLFQLFISTAIVFFPLVIFEIKSNFFTLRRLTTGLNIPPINSLPTSKLSLALNTFLTGYTNIKIQLWQSLLLILPLIINICITIKYPHKTSSSFKVFFILAFLSTAFTLLMPFEQSYYLYGVILLWFLVIASMVPLLMLPILIVLMCLWINPVTLKSHFRQALRTVSELNSCAKKFCSENPGKYYVSSNNWLGTHSAHDQAFFLNKNGCQSRDIVSYPSLGFDKMVVVADMVKFEPYKNTSYELNQFGSYNVVKEFICSDKIQYWLLEKSKSKISGR
jgi:hypothetical protein